MECQNLGGHGTESTAYTLVRVGPGLVTRARLATDISKNTWILSSWFCSNSPDFIVEERESHENLWLEGSKHEEVMMNLAK